MEKKERTGTSAALNRIGSNKYSVSPGHHQYAFRQADPTQWASSLSFAKLVMLALLPG